jgi:hypothetical protein
MVKSVKTIQIFPVSIKTIFTYARQRKRIEVAELTKMAKQIIHLCIWNGIIKLTLLSLCEPKSSSKKNECRNEEDQVLSNKVDETYALLETHFLIPDSHEREATLA